MKSILWVCLIVFSGAIHAQTAQRIPLKISDAYQTNYVGQDVTNLIDGDHNTRFNPGYNLITLPHNVVFDLSDYAPCTITRFVLWDGTGNGYNCQFVLVNAATGKEDTVYTFHGDNYMRSDTINLTIPQQFASSKLILRSPTSGNGYPDDLEVWGVFTPHTDPTWPKKHFPIKNQLGLVVHPWDIDITKYPAKYQAIKDLAISDVRLYSDAGSDKDENGAYILNPEKRGFQFETSFSQFEKDSTGIFRHICYQNQTPAVEKTWPVASQLNFEYSNYYLRDSVASYKSVAQDLFVLATRGGKNKNLPDYPIFNTPNWWEPRQQMVKGGGFYDMIEGGNEWNAWWTSSLDTYMGGAHLAAAWSMMYDGHKGRYPNCGVKQADPNVAFTNGGIAWDQPDLFREVVEWSKLNRGYLPNGNVDIPVDYFSYHSYSSVGGQYGNSKGGVPPEIGMIPQARKMVYFSNKYGGGKGMIIGEWGWDVHPNSPLNAPAYNGHTAEQTRAWWAMRGILKFSEVGIYRAEWYRAFQDYYPGDPNGGNYQSDNNPTQFATMALLRQVDDDAKAIKRTLVGDYFKQISEFGDYVFDEAIRSDSLNVLRFRKDTSYIYAVWAQENVILERDQRPQMIERTGKYFLQVPMNATVKIRTFTDDGSGVMQSRYDIAAGTDLPLDYSAKPLIVEIIGPGTILPLQVVSFTAALENKCVKLQWRIDNENLANYVVERSTDANEFSVVGTVHATRNTSYTYFDTKPASGKNYYRLKMVEENGSFKYSPMRMILMAGEKVHYTAYNFVGQRLYESDDLQQTRDGARRVLKQKQPYIIKGTDGTLLKILNE